VEALEHSGIRATVYDGVQPTPSIADIEAGVQLYRDKQCEGLIAFGGGSPMDCAKVIGARISNPEMSVLDMRGAFKFKQPLPQLFAIPTTAGTGSECSIGAVVTNPETHEKFPVGSTLMVPPHAVLDAELMLGLPPPITAATGMDALTHAVEAYIGRYGSEYTNAKAESAVRTILRDLEAVYADGSDLQRRHSLAVASHDAALAFSRTMLGYVHGIAHNLGGLYGVPHGKANAIVLPYVLEYSRADCEDKLAHLAVIGGLGDDTESATTLSCSFIQKIREMNQNMGIPSYVEELQARDIPLIAQRALEEANPGYPVPTLMNQSQCEVLVKQLLAV
jgi:alcohol dehydrogenase class IV